ncbi:histidine kinase [Solibacillus sp. MA9]|uniref:Histidine kinase n=1 Tax=Solibacillus palustris TaxID=2908203 RepID=A0ABS9UI37_9BACL|nr:ATP-binding protein [Solibacillus sp. MA9]MCH7324007.1 histidine kinase [Solibacillus sp. MA9]
MSRNSILGVKGIKPNLFWFIISTYLILGFYVLIITYTTPFISIELNNKDGQWEVEQLAYKKWAKNNNVSIGDIILSVNGTPISDFPFIEYDSSIRGAHHISIKKNNGSVLDIDIRHLDIPQQFYMQFVFPLIYFCFIFLITIYLYFYKRNIQQIKLLILFIITVSLAYISSGASGRMNGIGLIVNSFCLLLCLVLLIHFLKNYFAFLKIKWIFTNNIYFLYVLPIFAIILRVIRLAYPKFASIDSLIILSIFFILLLIILVILFYSYLQYKLPQLKILFIGLVIPFLPFFLLFVLPEILFKKPILDAEICALFLLLIPINFIFLQLTERLFDIVYYVTRLRYNLTITLIFTFWILAGLYFLIGNSLSKEMVWIILFIFISILLFLYIKEKIDYHSRKIVISSKGDYIHKLYNTIEKIGKSYKTEDMIKTLIQEISFHFELSDISVSTYDFEKNQIIPTKYSLVSLEKFLDVSVVKQLSLGEIVKKRHIYIAFIHEDIRFKRVLLIGHRNTIRLKQEELLWLELLLTYINSFIENTNVIEELLQELKQLQKTERNEPAWLKKLLWLRIEDEKFQLAQELHDTILQDHLHIGRQTELLIHDTHEHTIQVKLSLLHKQMVNSLEVLRTYCETLKPPLLSKLGLYDALERLVQVTTERAIFKLTSTFDRLYLEDEQLNLVIYRLIQELLNNALKHSQAKTVTIHLKELDNGFKLIYSDDGIGCDFHKISQSGSLGIQGMQERVEAYNGKILIDSQVNKGVNIEIIIIERSEINDYSTYSG